MDHLPKPQNPYRPLVVPYLGGEEYDNLDFARFPERKGWTTEQLSCLLGWPPIDLLGGRTIDDARAFLQSWLYFGTLSHVFGLNGKVVNRGDYIEKEEGETGMAVVTTKRLLSYVAEYHGTERLLPDARKSQHRQEVREFLPAVCCMVFRFDSIQRQRRDHDVGSLVLFSVSVLCTSLSSLLYNQAFNVGSTRILAPRMCQDGWCLARVAMICDTFFPASVYYIYLLGPPQASRAHRWCTESSCYASQVDDSSYQTKHLQDHCHCRPVGLDIEKITSISEAGGIPLISLSPHTCSSHFDCCVEEFKPGMSYVAISHVWSDGLGNVSENSLPLCQMEALRTRVSAMLSMTGTDLMDRVYLWIDTLCVPLSPESARKAAIVAMRRTYTAASHVLVLDAELMHKPRPSSALETRMRIVTSAWYSRLWTYQEGILARSLHFQFLDDLASGQELYEDEKRSEDERVTKGASNKHLVWSYPRSAILGYNSLRTEKGKMTLLEGVRWRSTSKIRDEPICIASVLNLDLAQLMKVPEKEQFKAMLWFQRVFRKGMLFYSGPRMSEDGYRWAPRSFMVCGEPILFGVEPAYFQRHPCGYTGLTFTSIGLSFGPVNLPANTEKFKLALPWEDANRALHVRCTGGSSSFLEELVDSHEPVALALVPDATMLGPILERASSVPRPPATGALVVIMLKEENILFSRFICLVETTRSLADDEKVDHNQSGDVGSDEKGIVSMGAAEIIKYQWWCVG